eukprot:TRINITY_DN4255_c0_g2_i4.p1 TRINITY_DN4255_c0_g2~~TRINITY_DN4255_c0_g2_i4.p1  ORF type:complete len:260 (+),score=31.18 TRINITY_DN4255_c0_g2_i4:39-782(+)
MPPKGILRVELVETDNSDCSNTVHVSYSVSDSVLSIKHKLHQLTGIPADSQTLYHPAVYLSDVTPVYLLSRSSDSIPTIRMHVVARGGASRPCNGAVPFKFQDVTSEECFENCRFAVSSGHGHMTVTKGLNFKATCVNPSCCSAQTCNTVYIQKGMYGHQRGYVSIRAEVWKLKCSACNSHIPSENWLNIVFHDCVAKIEWVLVDGTEGSTHIVTEKGKFTQAKQCNDLKEYHSLCVTVAEKGGSGN